METVETVDACIGMPPPCEFGVDGKYNHWRPQQDWAVQATVDNEKRFMMPICPTGFGKSLMYVVSALIAGGRRAVILTSTKALQDQLARDYGDVLVDIRGKDNYRCRLMGNMNSCAGGPCNFGLNCPWMKSGCEYHDQVRRASQASIVSTNYSYWMRRADWAGWDQVYQSGADSKGLGFDMMIGDEAHELPEILSNYLTKEIVAVRKPGYDVSDSIVRSMPDSSTPDRKAWAYKSMQAVGTQYDMLIQRVKEGSYDSDTLKLAKYMQRLREAMVFIHTCLDSDPDNLVLYRPKPDRVQASVVWPYDWTESALFKSIPRIVVTSATVTPKTLGLLGIDHREVNTIEADHPFPVENRQLYWVKTIQLNHRSSELQIRKWHTRIDQILRTRVDSGRKGIIHSVSYGRQKAIIERSEYAQYMIGHDGKTTQAQVSRFKQHPGPAILVSPVMTTGYDFPDDECRYQIIGKIAYPDTSDPVIKRRMEIDRDYASYIAMQRLIQTCGRGVRNSRDWCENFIIDDNVLWFMDRYAHFAPKWFRNSIVKLGERIPEPRSLS